MFNETLPEVLTGLAIFGGGIVVIVAAMPDSRTEVAEMLRGIKRK